MKNAVSLLVLSFMAASCINLQGSLNVTQTMTVKKKGGFLNMSTKTVEIEPRVYSAELKVNNENSFTLKLKTDENKEIQIPIKSEKELSLPSNGPVLIVGSDIKQPFDVIGNISTNVTQSDVYKTTESCTYNTTERRCENVCTTAEVVAPRDERRPPREPSRPGPGPGPREPREPGRPNPPRVICRTVCNDVLVTRYGQQYVEYHTRYTRRDLTANLVDAQSKNTLATFTGTDTDTQRINDYVGICR